MTSDLDPLDRLGIGEWPALGVEVRPALAAAAAGPAGTVGRAAPQPHQAPPPAPAWRPAAQGRPDLLGGVPLLRRRCHRGRGIVGALGRRVADELHQGHGEVAQSHVEMLTPPRQGRERSGRVCARRGHDDPLGLLDDPAVLHHLDHLGGPLLLTGAVLHHRDGTRQHGLHVLEGLRVAHARGPGQPEDHDEPAAALVTRPRHGDDRERLVRGVAARVGDHGPPGRQRLALRGVAVRHLPQLREPARTRRPPGGGGDSGPHGARDVVEQLLEHRPQQALARLPHGHDHHPRPADAIPSATASAPLPTPSGISSEDSCPLGGLNQTSFGDVYR